MLDDVPLAPLDRGEALELRGAAVLREARGVPGVDLDALADVVVAAGNLLLACPAVTALDVNSVLATADGAVAVDWKFSIDRPIGEVMDVGGADRRSRTAEVAHGLPGVRFTPGDSICAFYRGPGQRDDMPLP